MPGEVKKKNANNTQACTCNIQKIEKIHRHIQIHKLQ